MHRTPGIFAKNYPDPGIIKILRSMVPMIRLFRHWQWIVHGLWLRILIYEIRRLMFTRRQWGGHDYRRLPLSHKSQALNLIKGIEGRDVGGAVAYTNNQREGPGRRHCMPHRPGHRRKITLKTGGNYVHGR